LYQRIAVGVLRLVGAIPAVAPEPYYWWLRTGVVGVFPNDDSGTVFGGEVGVGDDYGPGVTVGYQFSERFGVELLGSTPVSHELQGKGALSRLGTVGEVDQLTPTLTLQYHPQLGIPWVKPYVGVGASYTTFFGEATTASLQGALADPGARIDVDGSGGVAAQLGADWPVTDRWSINTALWYFNQDTEADIEANGTTTSVDVEIDPWVTMIGASVRF